MSKKSKKILKEARQLIEESGWGKNFMHNQDTGAYCAVGAVVYVATGKDYYSTRKPYSKSVQKAFSRLAEAIDEVDPSVHQRLDTFWLEAGGAATSDDVLMSWNDGVARSKDQVLALFNRAING